VYLGFVRRTGPPLGEKYFFETVFYAVSINGWRLKYWCHFNVILIVRI
jgi:hypothetical protein